MFFVFRVATIMYLSLMTLPAAATPSATRLIYACEHALEYGFNDINGMLCTWYVTPCDCNQANKPEIPRVCLPPDIPVEFLAREVIDGIKTQEVPVTVDADYAAAKVLAKHYPCPE